MFSKHRALVEFVLEHLVWLMLATVLIVFSATVPNFFQPGIFVNIIESSTTVAIMAIGLAIVIIAGYMDLSVESVMALAAMSVAILFCDSGVGLDWRPEPSWLVRPISLAVALGVGALIGLFNGWLVVRLKMEAFIVTLASYIWVRGIVIAMSGGRSAQGLAPDVRFISTQHVLGLPLSAWITGFSFVAFTFMMRKTPFGRHITLIGGNAQAAYRAGIKVNQLALSAFVLAGAIAGLAGWLLAIRTSGASANLGIGMLFQAFAAVVIGGVSLKGGVGKLPGVYAGVLLLHSIQTAINLMGLPAHYTQIVLGLLVLAAVLLDTLKHTIRQKMV